MNRKPTISFDSDTYFSTKDFEVRYSNAYLPRKRKAASQSVEFFFFLDGKIALQLDQKIISLKRNDVVYLPQGTVGSPLIIDESRPNRLFFLRISKNYISQLKNLSSDFGYLFDFTVDPKPQLFRNNDIVFNAILSKIMALTDEIQANRYGRETKIYLVLNDLILHLNRMAFEHAEHPKLKAQRDTHNLYHNLVQYIELHLSEDLTLDHLAEVFYVSKFHIAHLFKENLGLSIHQYITKKRLSLCCDALIRGANISKTYSHYGFKDYSSFYRAFKKEYGLSPKAYREQQKFPNFTN